MGQGRLKEGCFKVPLGYLGLKHWLICPWLSLVSLSIVVKMWQAEAEI